MVVTANQAKPWHIRWNHFISSFFDLIQKTFASNEIQNLNNLLNLNYWWQQLNNNNNNKPEKKKWKPNMKKNTKRALKKEISSNEVIKMHSIEE